MASFDPLSALKKSKAAKAAAEEQAMRQRQSGVSAATVSDGSDSGGLTASEDSDDADSGGDADGQSPVTKRRESLRKAVLPPLPLDVSDTTFLEHQPRLLLQVRRERAAAAKAKKKTAKRSPGASPMAVCEATPRRSLKLQLAIELVADAAPKRRLSGGLEELAGPRRSLYDVVQEVRQLIARKPTGTFRTGDFGFLFPPDAPAPVAKSSRVLKKVKLKVHKEDRLQRIKKLATRHWSMKGRIVTGMTERERLQCDEVFRRYDYNRSGGLDLAECLDALADLGLKPMSRKEKLTMKQRLVDCEGGELDFVQFCSFVHERQSQVRDAQRQQLTDLFRQYDSDGSGSLSAEELLRVFKDLNLNPERDDERLAFLDGVLEADVDGSGEIEWGEFENLVQIVQQKLAQCRRQREVRICQQMGLAPETFLTSRHMLVPLHDAFRAFDRDGMGSVLVEDVPALMLDMGIDRNIGTLISRCTKNDWISKAFSERARLDFAVLLQVIHHYEESVTGHGEARLRTIFDMYDLDGSESITEEELLKLMRDLGIDWKDISEVTRLIDECDANGDGEISFDEFQVLFRRIQALHARQMRSSEREFAERLGCSDMQLRELREIFDFLDLERAGCLSFETVARGLGQLGRTLSIEDLVSKYDTERLGRIDFRSFMQIMHDTAGSVENPPAHPDGVAESSPEGSATGED